MLLLEIDVCLILFASIKRLATKNSSFSCKISASRLLSGKRSKINSKKKKKRTKIDYLI